RRTTLLKDLFRRRRCQFGYRFFQSFFSFVTVLSREVREGCRTMPIGIIGAGNIGAATAEALARAAIGVTIANSRGAGIPQGDHRAPWPLHQGRDAGRGRGRRHGAAVPWSKLPQALGVASFSMPTIRSGPRFSSEIF